MGIESRQFTKEILPEHHRDLMWMLGVLCAGGGTHRSWVELNEATASPEVLQSFNELGATIFGWKPFYSEGIVDSGLTSVWAQEIRSKLGDFRNRSWSDAMSRFDFLMHTPESNWAFLSGFFELNGRFVIPNDSQRGYQLRLNESTRAGCIYLCRLLDECGVEGRISLSGQIRDGVRAVDVYGLGQIKRFAENVDSVDPKKEAVLQDYRSIEPVRETYVSHYRSSMSVAEAENLDSLPKKETFVKPEPSERFAWLLGLLCGGGTVSLEAGIRIVSSTPELIARFGDVARSVSGLVPHFYYRGKHERKSSGGRFQFPNSVVLFNRGMVSFLGDLRENYWVDTADRNHPWVNDRAEYVAQFLSGFFDSSGNISDLRQMVWGNQSKSWLRFSTLNQKAAERLRQMLSYLGINGAKVHKGGVEINRIDQIRLCAEFLHPCTPEKAARLLLYKHYRVISEAPKRLLQAYPIAMRLRQETGLGVISLAAHPDLAEFNLSRSTIRGWLNGQVPQNDFRYKKRVIDEIPSISDSLQDKFNDLVGIFVSLNDSEEISDDSWDMMVRFCRPETPRSRLLQIVQLVNRVTAILEELESRVVMLEQGEFLDEVKVETLREFMARLRGAQNYRQLLAEEIAVERDYERELKRR